MAMSALRVTPSQLKSKAGDFSKDASGLKKVTNEMFSVIKELNGAVWSGDAAKAYTGQFNKLDNDVANMIKMVKEYSSDLQKIATEYEKTETANETASKKLKTEVITF